MGDFLERLEARPGLAEGEFSAGSKGLTYLKGATESCGVPASASNPKVELPVNLPDTTEKRGVAHPFPENSGQNASESGGKGKTGEGGSSAVISDCGRYRYRLERTGLSGSRTACVVMVNPSTADGSEDDATIRKVKGFAARHDIGRVIVVNQLAWRATDITDVRKAVDPIGPENDRHIEQAVRDADLVIVAWGPVTKLPPYLRRRWLEVDHIIRRHRTSVYCLGTAKCGHPRHPLMTPYDTPLTEWERPA